MSTLLEFVFESNEAKAASIAQILRDAGIATPSKFGGEAEKKPTEEPSADRSRRKSEALLLLASTALEEAVKRFDALDARILSRLRRAEQLKLGSAIATTVLSSGVVKGLSGSGPTPSWTFVAGVMALAAAILTVIVSRLEGGQLNVAKDYGSVAEKHEAARALSSRLMLYRNHPGLFGDIDARVAESLQLTAFLRRKEREWSIAI